MKPEVTASTATYRPAKLLNHTASEKVTLQVWLREEMLEFNDPDIYYTMNPSLGVGEAIDFIEFEAIGVQDFKVEFVEIPYPYAYPEEAKAEYNERTSTLTITTKMSPSVNAVLPHLMTAAEILDLVNEKNGVTAKFLGNEHGKYDLNNILIEIGQSLAPLAHTPPSLTITFSESVDMDEDDIEEVIVTTDTGETVTVIGEYIELNDNQLSMTLDGGAAILDGTTITAVEFINMYYFEEDLKLDQLNIKVIGE